MQKLKQQMHVIFFINGLTELLLRFLLIQKTFHHFKQFQSKNIPVVFFDRVFENSDGTKIIINNFQAGYDATSHLIEQGCKRIAHITSSLKRNVYAERMRGYKQALQDIN